jgi:hypothetical protein
MGEGGGETTFVPQVAPQGQALLTQRCRLPVVTLTPRRRRRGGEGFGERPLVARWPGDGQALLKQRRRPRVVSLIPRYAPQDVER